MDELFRDSPVFVPRSKWVPSSRLDEDAKRIAEMERKEGILDKEEAAEYVDVV